MDHMVEAVGILSVCMVVANIWPTYLEDQENCWTNYSYIFIAEKLYFPFIFIQHLDSYWKGFVAVLAKHKRGCVMNLSKHTDVKTVSWWIKYKLLLKDFLPVFSFY